MSQVLLYAIGKIGAVSSYRVVEFLQDTTSVFKPRFSFWSARCPVFLPGLNGEVKCIHDVTLDDIKNCRRNVLCLKYSG